MRSWTWSSIQFWMTERTSGFSKNNAGLASVAIHAVDYQFFEVLVEGVGEIVAGIGGSGLLEVWVGDGIVTDLLPEEFIGGGELGAEAIIEGLDHLGEGNGRVFIAAGADFGCRFGVFFLGLNHS
jgi:hypothetical protein